jgi:hypothetical protein
LYGSFLGGRGPNILAPDAPLARKLQHAPRRLLGEDLHERLLVVDSSNSAQDDVSDSKHALGGDLF